MDMEYVHYLPILRPARKMEKIVDTSKIVYLGDKSIFVFIIQQWKYTEPNYEYINLHFTSLLRTAYFM